MTLETVETVEAEVTVCLLASLHLAITVGVVVTVQVVVTSAIHITVQDTKASERCDYNRPPSPPPDMTKWMECLYS